MRGANLRLLLLVGALLSSPTLVVAQQRTSPLAVHVALPLPDGSQAGALAGEHRRWGGRLEEPAVPDIAGRWTGVWSGFGVLARRTSTALAEFTQSGRWGWGRIVLIDTLAADVPFVVTYRGALGVPVMFDVFQTGIVVKHEAGGSHLTVIFKVDGDRLVGTLRGYSTLIVLARQR